MTQGERNQIKGTIHSVESFGSVDGPGIRYVLFVHGCPLRCQFCHNPDTWAEAGKTATVGAILEDIQKYRSFIQNGGVTLSGGEPLQQPAFCQAILDGCRSLGLHTALDTSGAVPLNQCRGAVDASDLLLLDIKAMDPQICKELTGQDNQNALRLLDYCEQNKKPVWIRHVVIPGITALPERLEALAEHLADKSCIQRVELLPFHQMGKYKWEALNLFYPLADTPEPTEKEMADAQKIFLKYHLPLEV